MIVTYFDPVTQGPHDYCNFPSPIAHNHQCCNRPQLPICCSFDHFLYSRKDLKKYEHGQE